MTDSASGLVLAPFRALRPTVAGAQLAARLCPPYDVIDPAQRAALLAADEHNAVAVVLPEADGDADQYAHARSLLASWLADGTYQVDETPALYVYEMTTSAGERTRGLVGALGLRNYDEQVILPHENTMAGPVADRLALMRATETNVEAIYLVYDGGGPASTAVANIDASEPVAATTTADGVQHRLWSITDPDVLDGIARDLAGRRALIADGHHRYATYLALQSERAASDGPGPWDFGLTLLVDSSSYGPQVHAIHRVVPGHVLADAVDRLAAAGAHVADLPGADAVDPTAALDAVAANAGFAALLTDGQRMVEVTDPDARLRTLAERPGEPAALADLDVTVLHRGIVEGVWQLADDVDHVGYAHTVDEAITAARAGGGFAVLLRPTPVAAVAAVAAQGARMPRKSTLFTPKPASGMFMRRFADA